MIEGGKRSEGDRISSEGKQEMIRGGRRGYHIIGRTREDRIRGDYHIIRRTRDDQRGRKRLSYHRANRRRTEGDEGIII
jgi:hypothetical protein